MDRSIITIPAIFIIIIIVAVAGYLLIIPGHGTFVPIPQKANHAMLSDVVDLAFPLANTTVSSPLTIAGRAKTGWYVSGSAPVELKNANGKVIAQGTIESLGSSVADPAYEPFSGSLTFDTQPAGSNGTLLFKNPNPQTNSTDQELDVSVNF